MTWRDFAFLKTAQNNVVHTVSGDNNTRRERQRIAAIRERERQERISQLHASAQQPRKDPEFELWNSGVLALRRLEQNSSPIADAVLNTGGRIRRGEYIDAINGIINGVTEVGIGRVAGGGQRRAPSKVMLRGMKHSDYDGSRAAVAGYLAEKAGKTGVKREDIVGNLRKTDPYLVDSNAIISMPRYKLRRLLHSHPEEADLKGLTIRGLSTAAVAEAADRGYETWPSASFAANKHPNVVSWDDRTLKRGKIGSRPAKSEHMAIVYSPKADDIPSVLSSRDSVSPRSGKVVEMLEQGMTTKDIISRWMRDGFLGTDYYVDSRSKYGIFPKFVGREFDYDEYFPSWKQQQELMKKEVGVGKYGWRRDGHNVAERKFIDDVPFDSDYIQAGLIPRSSIYNLKRFGPLNRRVASDALNKKYIPFVTVTKGTPGDFGFDLPYQRCYERLNDMELRALEVLRGGLLPLKNEFEDK